MALLLTTESKTQEQEAAVLPARSGLKELTVWPAQSEIVPDLPSGIEGSFPASLRSAASNSAPVSAADLSEKGSLKRSSRAADLVETSKDLRDCAVGVTVGTAQFCWHIAQAPVRLAAGFVSSLFVDKDTPILGAFSAFLITAGSKLTLPDATPEANGFGYIAVMFGIGVGFIGVTNMFRRETWQKFASAFDYDRPLHHVLFGIND